MAVLLLEGFDNLNTITEFQGKGWTSTSPANMVFAATGRFTGQAVSTSGGGGAITRLIVPGGTTYSTVFWGFAWLGGNVNTTDVMQLLTTGNTVAALKVQFNASNQILIKNNGGTTIATGTTSVNRAVYNYLEIKAFQNGASGTVEVHLNGVLEISSTVGNFGSVNFDGISWSGASASITIDDIYVCDTSGSAPNNTFLGDSRVLTIWPSADGAHTQWTPNSGSPHFSRVNETNPDGDTSFVSDSTTGHYDTYVYPDIDTLSTVYAVQVCTYARKDDATVRQIANVIRQASTDYDQSTQTLGSSYLYYLTLMNLDPTGAAWTPANVNADEFGIKMVA